jgi:hypothetical protein
VSLGISALIAVQAWKLLRESAEVLLEATPAGLDLDSLADTMTGVDGVEGVAHATLELECEACGEPADFCAIDAAPLDDHGHAPNRRTG